GINRIEADLSLKSKFIQGGLVFALIDDTPVIFYMNEGETIMKNNANVSGGKNKESLQMVKVDDDCNFSFSELWNESEKSLVYLYTSATSINDGEITFYGYGRKNGVNTVYANYKL
ncbi:hypothetical protein, partial [Lishizhenia sp.]|uniref:hypothetical protein n=1 Tax=Lishizhenia sp. TaxID=2497594 RepID=UPI00299E173A